MSRLPILAAAIALAAVTGCEAKSQPTKPATGPAIETKEEAIKVDPVAEQRFRALTGGDLGAHLGAPQGVQPVVAPKIDAPIDEVALKKSVHASSGMTAPAAKGGAK